MAPPYRLRSWVGLQNKWNESGELTHHPLRGVQALGQGSGMLILIELSTL